MDLKRNKIAFFVRERKVEDFFSMKNKKRERERKREWLRERSVAAGDVGQSP